jgi:hypothetical protein
LDDNLRFDPDDMPCFVSAALHVKDDVARAGSQTLLKCASTDDDAVCKIGAMMEAIPRPLGVGVIPDEESLDRAVGIARSRRAAIICMAAAVVCFMVSLYLWDNSIRELDVSVLEPATTEPAK